MRRKQIGVMDFHGSVDITDPCYEKEVWCRMNGVKIRTGAYTCMVWHHTEKGTYSDGCPYSCELVGIIGIYLDGLIPRQRAMKEIGTIGVDSGMAGFFHDKPDYSDEAWSKFCDRVCHGDAWRQKMGSIAAPDTVTAAMAFMPMKKMARSPRWRSAFCKIDPLLLYLTQ